MKKTFTTLFILLLLFCSTTIAQVLGESGWRLNEKQVRISVVNPNQVKQLSNLKLNMDFYGPDFNHITAYVTPEELKQIESLGIP